MCKLQIINVLKFPNNKYQGGILKRTIKQLIESLSKIEEKNSEITEIYFSENSLELMRFFNLGH